MAHIIQVHMGQEIVIILKLLVSEQTLMSFLILAPIPLTTTLATESKSTFRECT